MGARRWHGVESEKATRRRLRNGDVAQAYGGAFVVKMTPLGGVLERCIAGNTWETKYRTVDEYVVSLKEILF